MMTWTPPRPYAIGVGLMSGTSLDGVDAAVVRLEGSGLDARAELLHFHTRAYGEPLRESLRKLCDPAASDVESLCGMNVYMAELFSEAVLEAVRDAGLSMSEVDFVSSHGQTVWHMPEPPSGRPHLSRSTLQIGDLSVLAKLTGVVAVGDFRPADLAVGGQGAPLAPYGDLVLLRHPDRGRLLQNIGGIGNCTALPAGAGPQDVFAFDTGPGNMVIDAAVHRLTGGAASYDAGGAMAARGTPDAELLAELLEHPYFRMPPPKSTGRELFGAAYADGFLERAAARGLGAEDIVATATALTARSIADACRQLVLPRCEVHELVVSGGGACNATLLTMLSGLLPELSVTTSGSLGIPDDAKEAVIFALLGHDFLLGQANNLPSATGASRPTVLGKLALP
ncbi:anhydro-N-acetylmuramic acid kinase [Paenibacillus humicus]|uniref:anhydro-N-acetylmuramic acid kinase n=1 Tax=Paenibacillus humicus TaxID=412861 RepID=UPI001FEBBFF7|nr:anhydro-N-acetylmuramic acid kinase [Paenibacillus humicus]